MRKITILLVDDHKLIRDSWSMILGNDPRFQVIGESHDGEGAIAFVKAKKPQIILMDVNMSPVNGFDATMHIKKHSPTSKVIGISMYCIPSYAKRMFQMGAMGYVTKNSSKDEMIEAILEVNGGNKYVCNEVKNILARQELEDDGTTHPDMTDLSRREMGIIELIKEGMSSKEIAIKLELSLKTVEAHRYNILKKLNLKNTASLINFIKEQGL